ncbi:MAG: hypothetical protein ACE5GW_14275, partial [Planctomycetota bacterium]
AAGHGAGLDFIVITDHNTLEARERQGYHDGLLLAVEMEITPSIFGNHLLALGLDEAGELHRLRRPEAILEALEAQGGVPWVPHPRGFLNPWCAVWNTPWKLWDRRIAGIELSTFLVEWVEGLRPWNVFQRLRRPHRLVADPDPRVLELWDRLNRHRPVAGFIGIDAHYRQKLGGRLRTPSYEWLFGTHNLLAWCPPPGGDPETDLRALRQTLLEGRFVNVFAGTGGREPARFERRGREVHLELPPTPGTQVHIFRDGTLLSTSEGGGLSLPEPDPGVYRAEVRRDGRLWMLTNPLRVTAAATEERVEASRPRAAESAPLLSNHAGSPSL